MSRIAFASFGSLGDVLPSIGVARELVARGHEVLSLMPRPLSAMAMRLGLDTYSVGSGSEIRALRDQSLFTLDASGFAAWGRFADEYLEPLNRSVLPGVQQSLERFRPDLVVAHPFAHFAATAANSLQLPWVSLHMYPQIAAERSGSVAGHWAINAPRFQALLQKQSAILSENLNAAAAGCWSPLGCYMMHDPSVAKGLAATAVDCGEYVGFPFTDLAATGETPTGQRLPLGERSGRVLIVFGSMVGNGLVGLWDAVVGTLGRQGFDVSVYDPPTMVANRLQGSAVHLVGRDCSILDAVADADVVVHHGGIGAMYAGLYGGLAAVVVPQTFDQQFNAVLLEQMGAGLVASSPDELGEAVGNLLEQGLPSAELQWSAATARTNIADRLLTHV